MLGAERSALQAGKTLDDETGGGKEEPQQQMLIRPYAEVKTELTIDTDG
jgi:hypothetical protein